jgi:hypothetical protein
MSRCLLLPVLALWGCEINVDLSDLIGEDGCIDLDCEPAPPECHETAGAFLGNFEPVQHDIESDITGYSILTFGEKEELHLWMEAENLAPNQVVGLQMWGLFDGSEAICPSPLDDTDYDGLVTYDEVFGASGRSVLAFTPYSRTTESGHLRINELFERGDSCPIADRVLILFGGQHDGEWDAMLPVACADMHVMTDEEHDLYDP